VPNMCGKKCTKPPSSKAAKVAIDNGLYELQMDHGGTPEERQALSDALVGLMILRRELERRSSEERSSEGYGQP
jgi:hypothetical protein